MRPFLWVPFYGLSSFPYVEPADISSHPDTTLHYNQLSAEEAGCFIGEAQSTVTNGPVYTG